MKSSIKLLIFIWFSSFTLSAQPVRKVACIGDSVTKGYGLKNQANTYPEQLQELLGPTFQVQGFGRNGATLLSKGHNPYLASEELERALAFKPDLVLIMLGLNDTDPRNWPNH
ncbi:MAG TPA: sialate O-acetylesterase, partial [Candidatus Sphingobacterium stercorigallinarum]|nr:sialate O-acetylesterase [Candidatus Sphingobacterium stercorigallinarum]